MKALSIRQPWAWAILNAGKRIENRDWKPSHPDLKFRGPFLLHTGLGMTRVEYLDFVALLEEIAPTALPRLPPKDELPRGGIVGCARLVAVVTEHPSPWFFGPYGLVLADVQPLPFVRLSGKLGFFDVAEAAVREALA